MIPIIPACTILASLGSYLTVPLAHTQLAYSVSNSLYFPVSTVPRTSSLLPRSVCSVSKTYSVEELENSMNGVTLLSWSKVALHFLSREE